jgi:hypothetical protein
MTLLVNLTNLLDLIAEMEKLVARAANLFRELRAQALNFLRQLLAWLQSLWKHQIF